MTYLSLIPVLMLALGIFSCSATNPGHEHSPKTQATPAKGVAQAQYLEIVTQDVDATCSALEKVHGVTFGAPIQALGNARTAPFHGGGQLGVRAPMHAAEKPVVRPYLLVADIQAAVENAKAKGGQIAMPPTKIEGMGQFAIYFLGGIEHGLWQL